MLQLLSTCVVFGTLPFWIKAVGLYPYLGVEVMIWVIYALGFNLLLGTAGLPSFGHGAYFGVGAYAFGLSQIHWGSGLWPARWQGRWSRSSSRTAAASTTRCSPSLSGRSSGSWRSSGTASRAARMGC